MSKAKAEAKLGSTQAETVKVVIRCRPMSQKEMQAGHDCVVQTDHKKGEIFVNKPGTDDGPK